MHIKKITLEVAILIEASDMDWFSNLSLAEIAREMDEGTVIGTVPSHMSEDIPTDRVAEELHAMGNDGSFFDHLRSDAP